MSKAATLQLKGGTLEEPAEEADSIKLPTRRQLMRLETDITKLPTFEILRRVYKRHSTGVWQTITVITWAAIIYQLVK
jgi:hypothetical protein